MKKITIFLCLFVIIASSSSKGTAKLDNKKHEQTTTTTPKIKHSEQESASEEVSDGIVVREESVKIVERQSDSDGTYHIIIGSFKVLENARTLVHEAVEEGYLPSIMENDDGLYRVAIYSGDESAARKKIAELKEQNKYEGIWLLKEK